MSPRGEFRNIDTSAGTRLASLAEGFQWYVRSYPDAADELADFYLKHAHDDYVDAVTSYPGTTAAVSVRSVKEADYALRRVLLCVDLALLTWPQFGDTSRLSFVPLPDSLASPVLGISTKLDPETLREVPVSPSEIEYAVAIFAARSRDRAPTGRGTLLGWDWSRGERQWERSLYVRTSAEFENAVKQPCHIAAGYVHSVPDGLYRWLAEDAFDLVRRGRLAPTPFLTPSESASESAVKSGLLGAFACTLPDEPLTEEEVAGVVHPVAQFDVPYLEGAPLGTYLEVLEDERESVEAFRGVLGRTLRDVQRLAQENPEHAREIVRQVQTEEIEDRLGALRGTHERLKRKGLIASVNAALAVGGLTIGAILGADPASLLVGVAGAAGAVNPALEYFSERNATARSPVQFLWRLQRAAD